MRQESYSTIVIESVLAIGIIVCALLLLGPLADAWLSYGIGTGIFATLLLGPLIIGAVWIGLDILREQI